MLDMPFYHPVVPEEGVRTALRDAWMRNCTLVRDGETLYAQIAALVVNIRP